MRKNLNSFFKNRIPLFIFISFYLIFSVITYKQYGISYDEKNVYLRGKLLYTKIRGNDKILQKDFVVKKDTENNDLLFYNGAYAAGLYVFNDSESYEIYHLENLLFALFIFIALYELIFNITKNKWLPLIGIVFLFFTPRFIGHIPANPKDIPFAVFYFISLTLIILSQKWDEKFRILILGASFGLTQGSRIVGYSIYPIFIIFSLISLLEDLKKSKTDKIKKVISLTLEVIIIFFIGYLIHMITLPYLGADPFNHFIDLVNLTKTYPWEGTVLMFGKDYLTNDPKQYYLPVWIIVTTPIFILILSIISLFKIKSKSHLLFVISLLVNLGIYFVLNPILYDGLRQMLFLIPQFVVLSVFGLESIVENKAKAVKYVGLFLVALNILLVAKQYYYLHPYEYIYFNELVGNLTGAYQKYETDYWAMSSVEASKWLRNYLVTKNIYKAKVGICGPVAAYEYYFKDMKDISFGLIPTKAVSLKYDYSICWERFNENEKVQGKIIHIVSREGVPLKYIYEITKK